MEMRKVYAQTIREIAEKDQQVYVLEADLSSAIATSGLKEVLGPRYVNVGIMEANMMGLAAGISVSGGVAFVHSFGQFATRRAFDQVFVSLAYAQQHVVIVGSDAGVTAEHNGGTHMTFEDTGLMRLVPHAHVYDIADAAQLKAILYQAYEEPGVHYLRIARKEFPDIYDSDQDFSPGAIQLAEGQDVTLIANGICVAEALAARDLLAKEGIDAGVIDCYRLKPLNEELILEAAKDIKLVVTIENHNVIGGLGSAIAEVLAEKQPQRLVRIGVKEAFGQVGKLPYLKNYYGISAEKIAQRVVEELRK